MKNVFYVYEHWRPDKNICFYVGKGIGNRAWRLYSRNKHHQSIQSKLLSLGLAVDIRIIAKDLTEEAAFALEISQMLLYPKEQLANKTLGGGGIAGFRHKPEFGKMMKKLHTGNKYSVGRIKSEKHIAKLREVHKGNKYTLGRVAPQEERERRSKSAKLANSRRTDEQKLAHKENTRKIWENRTPEEKERISIKRSETRKRNKGIA